MPVIGSSAVIPPGTVRGPTGLPGLTGNTGAAGTGGTGATGYTGATGTYVFSGSTDGNNLILVLSDGKEIIIENLKGPTGELAIAGGISGASATHRSIFKEVTDGITFYFRGLSAEGNLHVYQTDSVVGISGDIINKAGATADGMIRNRFSYISAGAAGVSADSSGLTFDNLGTVQFGYPGGATGFAYDPEEIVVRIPSMPLYSTGQNPIIYGITGGELDVWDSGPTAGDGVGILLDVRQGSVFQVETPTGIRGFTGDFFDKVNNTPVEAFNFTMMLGGYDIWDWPKNVFFEDDELYFSCGWDIINFLTNDGGETWKANITVRGYGVDDCLGSHGLGSCCYLDGDNEINCIDYISENDCIEKESPFGDGAGGAWNQLATCANACGVTGSGVCCSEGGDWGDFNESAICLENIGANECDVFGGTYWTHIYYREDTLGRMIPLDGDGENPEPITCDINLNQFVDPIIPYTNLLESWDYPVDGGWPCLNPCEVPIACCKDGECIGDSFGNGPQIPPISWAMCKFVYGGKPILNRACNDPSGDFVTPDCCDFTIYVGACCLSDSCTVTSNFICDSNSGVFMGPDTVCYGLNAVDCCNNPIGACCHTLEENVCTPGSEDECIYPNIWMGPGTACEDGCPGVPAGACCTGSTCQEGVTQMDCPGTWGGPYSECCPAG